MLELVEPNVWEEEELAEAARVDLGEEPGRMDQDLTALREWIRKSPHLQNIKTDDNTLKCFLRGCKFSLERTKEKLDFHFTVRGNLPEWFNNWDPRDPKLAKVFQSGAYLPLPGYDKHGRFVVLIRQGQLDPLDRIEDGFKAGTMVMDLAKEGNTQSEVRGFVLVQDMAGMTGSHVVQMNPVVMRKAMTVWEDAYPARPQALHFVSIPPVMEGMFNMVQGLQKEKMRQRNHVHPKGDMSKVVADLGPEVLPPEFGGTGPNLDTLTQYWIERLEQRRAWLMEQVQYRTEEHKRPGKPRNHADIFGIEGSFRKLEID